jgi:hypothetical protein
MNDETWSECCDTVHAIGLDHLEILAEAARMLREALADCPTGPAQRPMIEQLVQVSHTMLGWTHYLIPKGPPMPTVCPACEAAAMEDDDDE